MTRSTCSPAVAATRAAAAATAASLRRCRISGSGARTGNVRGRLALRPLWSLPSLRQDLCGWCVDGPGDQKARGALPSAADGTENRAPGRASGRALLKRPLQTAARTPVNTHEVKALNIFTPSPARPLSARRRQRLLRSRDVVFRDTLSEKVPTPTKPSTAATVRRRRPAGQLFGRSAGSARAVHRPCWLREKACGDRGKARKERPLSG